MKKIIFAAVSILTSLSIALAATPTKMTDHEMSEVVAGYTVVKSESTGITRYVGGPNSKLQYEYKITTGYECSKPNGLGTCASTQITYEWRNR